jgi:PilZ domain
MAEDAAVPPANERRSAPRFNISMPVTVYDAATGRGFAATVDNISLGGVLLLLDEPIDAGSRLFIDLPIAADMSMRIEASLVRSSDLGEFGVAFVSLTDDDLDRLGAFFEARSNLM